MGRRGDPPGLQAAKRHPGKRPQTVKARLAEARRVAKLLAEAPAETGDKLAPPKFLDGRFPGAIAVWRSLGPKLRETHRLPAQHRVTFAMFCVYVAEWVAANEDIAKNGATQMVPTVSGGEMERIRPIVKFREIAFGNIMALSKTFGLTPTDEYALFSHQRVAAQSNPSLFDGLEETKPGSDGDVETPAEEPQQRTMIGGLSSLDGLPPGARAN